MTRTLLCTAGLVLALAAPAAAQSMSPMEKEGYTPSATKGFRVHIGNPYPRRMTFVLVATEPDFKTPAEGVTIRPSRVTMAPEFARGVLLAFDINPKKKERTIGLCIMPEAIDGPIMPRVCGRFTGRMLVKR